MFRIILAGTPATIVFSGTDLFTTAPAATTTRCPIFTPDKILQPLPIHTSSAMVIGLLVAFFQYFISKRLSKVRDISTLLIFYSKKNIKMK